MATSWLAANENKSPVDSIEFSGEDAVKAMKARGECLAVVYKTTSCRSLEK
jgi:hypothetical protein